MELLLALVAIRKESVDRNRVLRWDVFFCIVALRKESVDRNSVDGKRRSNSFRRSPQGERG